MTSPGSNSPLGRGSAGGSGAAERCSAASCRQRILEFLFKDPALTGSPAFAGDDDGRSLRGTAGITRAPAPLLFSVAAIFHVAPPPAMPLARVDKVNTAVGSLALSDSRAINIRQQIFDSKCAGVQRKLGRRRARPVVGRETS